MSADSIAHASSFHEVTADGPLAHGAMRPPQDRNHGGNREEALRNLTGAEPQPAGGHAISPDEIRAFRQRAMANGYSLVRVRSGSKAPLPHDWQHGDRPGLLLDVQPDALNTGLVLAGLRCIDIDVDDPQLISKIMDAARIKLPTSALLRSRANSPRLAMLFRAAEGQPPKRVLRGTKSKIEVLGAGQQVVAHGLHPTGAALTWSDGRGPDTVSLADVPTVIEDQITRFLDACASLLGANIPSGSSPHHASAAVPSIFTTVPPHLQGLADTGELGAGIERRDWFKLLTPEEQSDLVRASLNKLDNRTSDPRARWLDALFATAHADQLGCPDAHDLALDWSKRGASWTSEADFETAWRSYKTKPGGITIGTLLRMAREAGLDVSSWHNLAVARWRGVPSEEAGPVASPSASSAGRALPIANLPQLPAKRQWLHGTDLVRGAVSLLVAPGGRGKTSWIIALSLACASGQQLLGSHVFGGQLDVLFINAEDGTSELALRFRAAMQHHGLTDDDVPGLHVAGADILGITLLRPDGGVVRRNESGWIALTTELDRIQPDVLVLDPLVSLMGGASVNDNAAATLLMGGLISLAAERRIGIMVAHHASKGRDPMSAESAMGAASFVNLARIALAIEPLAEKDAPQVGLPSWEAGSVFRIVGTKQNLRPADDADRWYRLKSVQMQNAQPPVYPTGDRVGVVEEFKPGASGPTFPPALVYDVLRAIASAAVPLSPSRNARTRFAGPVIAQAIAPHRGGRASDTEAMAVLDHLMRTGLIKIDDVKLVRKGGRSDERNGLVLTSVGEQALQANNAAPSPQFPQGPATSLRDDAGGAPFGPPQRPRGCGGDAGGKVAGTSIAQEARNDTILTDTGGGARRCRSLL